ncbi:MAG TPA: tetratricopeptide repeat protein [Treponemataceae bacterium]|nr:tetratricopeptide repeat protein [Treponemataceae bacterium]
MSDDKSYLLNRAKGAVLSRDFSLAARLYKTLLKSEPDNVEYLSQLGSVYVREGNDEKALTAYQSVISKDPGNFSALNSLGGIYRRLGRYEDSIAVLETALATGVNENAVYYNMGHTYKLMGNYEDAADCFITVIDENPNDVLAYNHLGSIQAARGGHQKALQTYARALQLDRNHPILHYNSAKSYIALGKLKEAKTAYENALRSHPGWIEAMDDYAHLLIKMNLYTESQDILLQAKKIDAKNLPIRNSLGLVYEYLGKYEAAQDSFSGVLSEDPENYTAQLGLSSVLFKQKKYEEAEDILERMGIKHPDDSKIALQYASVLLKLNRLSEVVSRLNKLYAQDSDNPELLNLVSQYALLKNEEFRIKGFFAKIARVAPEYYDHFKDIAELYYDRKEFDKAEKNIKLYLSKKSNDAYALLLLGKIYESLHHLRKALETYKKAFDQKDKNRNFAEDSFLSKELQDSVQRVGELLSEEGEIEEQNTDEPMCECPCPEDTAEDEKDEDADGSFLDDQPLGQIVPFDENEIIEGLEEPLEFETLFEEKDEPVDNDDEVIDMSELVSDDEPIDFDTINALDDPFEETGSKPNQYIPDEDPEFLDVDGDGYDFEDEDIADNDEKEEELFTITPEKTEDPVLPPPPPQYPAYPQYPPPPEPRKKPEPNIPPTPLWNDEEEEALVEQKPVKREDPKKEPETPAQEEKKQKPEDFLSDESDLDEPFIDEPEIEEPSIDEPQIEEPVFGDGSENGISDEPFFGEPESDEGTEPEFPVKEEEPEVDERKEEYVLPEALLDYDDFELPLDEDAAVPQAASVEKDETVEQDETEEHDVDAEQNEADKQGEMVVPQEDSEDSFPEIDDVDESPLSDEAMDFLENDENALMPLNPDDDQSGYGVGAESSASTIVQKISDKISNLETLCDSSESIQYTDLSALLENLKDLCNFLPQDKKSEYLSSLDHLRIDFLLKKMSGSPGLLRTAQSIREFDGIPDAELDSIELDSLAVQKTLEYLKDLVRELHDKKIASILSSKISDLLSDWE